MHDSNRPTKIIETAAVCALALLAGSRAVAQDSNLFQAKVAPNVMLMVDNSGSMNHIVWHPAFDPTVDSSCSNWVSGFGPETTWTFSSDLTLTACGNTRTLYADTNINGRTRITERYLNWYFSDEATSYTDPATGTTWPIFAGSSNNDPYNLESLANGQRSSCLTDPSGPNLPATYSKYRRSRITAAQEVLREVVCQVNAVGEVRFGLAQFYTGSDPEGGWVKVPIDDYTLSHAAAIDTFIDDLAGEAWTPLSETLYNVYRYFQSRTNPALGKDGTTAFPAYDITPSGATTTDPSLIPPSPAQYACQKNFVILITDGEPTKDDFDGMDLARFENDLVGDYNPDNALPEAGDETPASCAFCNETTFYLDDLAKFMQDNDFQLDLPGDQVIDIYTVGFTTAAPANALLRKTAVDVGNGLFFKSNNAEELTAAIVEQISEIIEKAQSFTSATVPASRTTDGANFYSSYFLPKDDSGFWEGHLKNFEFNGAGDILDVNGECATGPPGSLPPGCPGGTLRTTAPAFWDAADELPAPSQRTLYVGFSNTAFGDQPALWSSVDDGDLGLTNADASTPPYDAITASGGNLGDIANAIVASLSGCEFGSSPCTPRTNDTGGPAVLGDIFHSNPIVVGSPNSAVNEDAYGEFAIEKRTRSRVIYAGANDGFLHAFNAGDWQTLEPDGITPRVPPSHDRGTGVEIFGFMPYAVRNTAKVLPTKLSFPRAFETVDASPVVADVWFYRDVDNSGDLLGTDPNLTEPDKVKEQWRTVLLGGLRNGGSSYYALDITNPPSTGDSPPSDYPQYLWEFPCEDCGASKVENPGTSSETVWMGSTWSDPVVTRVRVASDTGSNPEGYERWVAIFGAGYDACGDPYSGFYGDPSACVGNTNEPKGRAIYMLDITTGEVLAKKFWSPAAVRIPSASGTQIGFPEMRYAFASAPTVFDVDFDGFADVVYIGDLGGNIWKWVISDIGDDPINNTSSNNNIAQPDWDFRIFFQAGSASSPLPSTYDASYPYQSFFFPATGALRDGELVIALGAGQRANTQYPDSDGLDATNNHYYVIRDADPRERAPSPPDPLTGFLDEDDLATNAQLDSVSCVDLRANYAGFFLTGRDAEKFITNSVIFTGELFFGSFIPPDPMTTNPCEATGEAYLYNFDLDCGVGTYDNPGTGNEDRRRFVGTGLPTRPRVSVGGLNEGDQTPSCNNKVIVITSDGGIESKCKTLPSKGVDVRSWRTR